MGELPVGTVTFLFTDIEGSTRLWQEDEASMRQAVARHDQLLGDVIADYGGVVFSTMGDGLAAAFQTASAAVSCAVEAQRMLDQESWETVRPLRVRMGLHTGEAELRGGDYFGTVVNRAARLMGAGHGGQVLVSSATAEVVGSAALVDLGEHRLRDLARPERVFQLNAPGLPKDFPPLRSSNARLGNLPRQMTSFVGRAGELAQVADALRERPLVTLTGVGGVGKTRLALQAAAEGATEFPDGVWLCELAPLTNPDAVWETLAASLAVKPVLGRSLSEAVLEYLATRRLLVVLDNCEHLLDAAARIVDAVEQGCPGVVVLATSREGLGLAGERILAVPSLGLPDHADSVEVLSSSDAVRLFVERARDAKADFAFTPHNAVAVGQLCRRLDGIPLALELAAARVRSLTPNDLLDRIGQRFTLLTRGRRAALERQQTLRRTIDWSYDLLSPPEREALLKLSVFAGGGDLPAAEGVLSGGTIAPVAVVDVLGQLVDKSLLSVDDYRGRARYRMLETIRQYGQDRLDDSGTAPLARRAHAEYYLALAESAGPHLRGGDQLAWSQDLAVEIGNLRTALDWAVEQEAVDHALRLVAPLTISGLEVGDAAMDWAAAAAAIPGADQHPLFGWVASWAAWGATARGDYDRAGAVMRDVAAVEDERGTWGAAACRAAATLAFFTADLDAACRYADEWVAVARAQGDAYEVCQALIMQASAVNFGGHGNPVPVYEEAVRIARQANIPSALAIGLSSFAVNLTHVETLDPEAAGRAVALAEEAIEVGTVIGDSTSVDIARNIEGHIALRRGDFRVALETYAETAERIVARGGRTTAAVPLLYSAAAAFAGMGQVLQAAVLLGASDTLWPTRFGPAWLMKLLSEVDATLLQQLGANRISELRSQGADLGNAEAVEYLRVQAARALANE
jgi:predicted ATPase/class 3 adenylate cyclase